MIVSIIIAIISLTYIIILLQTRTYYSESNNYVRYLLFSLLYGVLEFALYSADNYGITDTAGMQRFY